MLGIVALLAALTGGPSQLDSHAQNSAKGTALAWEMAEKLRTAVVDEAYVFVRPQDLDNRELIRFLGAWRMTAPGIPASIRIRAEAQRLLAILERGPGRVRMAPKPKPLSPLQLLLPPRAAAAPGKRQDPHGFNSPRPKVHTKSMTVAALLSVLFGFGTGNFYAEAYPYGTSMAAIQVVSIGVFAGSRKFRNTALAIYVGTRFADMFGAVVNVRTYNTPYTPGRDLDDWDVEEFIPITLSLPVYSLRW